MVLDREPKTPQHDGMQRWCDLLPTQPFRRSRGREVEVAIVQVEEDGSGQREEGLVGVVCSPPPLGPPLYRGEGCTLSPSPSHKGGGWGTAKTAPKTLTLAD
jgi:hypothetical protein